MFRSWSSLWQMSGTWRRLWERTWLVSFRLSADVRAARNVRFVVDFVFFTPVWHVSNEGFFQYSNRFLSV